MAQNKSFVPQVQLRSQRVGMQVVKPKDLKGTLLMLWGYMAGERKSMLIVFLLSALSSASAIFTPAVIGRAIDAIKISEGPGLILLILFSIYVFDAFVRLFQGRMNAAISQRIVLGLRKALFSKLGTLPLSFFDTHTHGELMSRLTNDIDNISTTISESLTQLMLLSFTVVGILIMMIFTNIALTFAVLAAVPLVLALTKVVTSRSRKLYKRQLDVLGTMNGNIEETVTGFSVIKAFSREDGTRAEFERLNDEFCDVGTKAIIWSGFLMPLMNVINNLCFVSVTLTGGVLALKGYISVGLISTFLLYSRQFTRPLNDISNIYNMLQTAVAGAERVFEIMEEPPEEADRPSAVPIENPRGDVEFQNVCFGYSEGTTVINGISFKIKAGTKVAIVGSTGSGKTTIISLLTRFYDVTSGKILIDGRDIRDYTRESLRKSFGVVLQDPALFDASVRDNIRYGKPEATDAQVEEAARIACADGFIRRLPEGYDTLLGDSGGTLSEGERQLLTIARAVLTDAPILILDEATSSVDTRSEQNIRRAMLRMTSGRTSFIIAHRLSTIRDSDLILVIENGRIAESGTHEELIRKGGIYCLMYKTQTGLE